MQTLFDDQQLTANAENVWVKFLMP